MRKLMGAAVIGLTALGGAVIAGGAQAQPYGYYRSAPSGYYDNGYYRSTPYYNGGGYNNGYYAPNGYYNNGYYNNGYNTNGAGLAGALIGSLLGQDYAGNVPVDRFGPDPNGMIAPDGHRIKCKLRTGYDDYGRYHTYRQCY